MNICKECHHYKFDMKRHDVCTRSEARDCVTGDFADCRSQRDAGEDCGPYGKHFVERYKPTCAQLHRLGVGG